MQADLATVLTVLHRDDDSTPAMIGDFWRDKFLLLFSTQEICTSTRVAAVRCHELYRATQTPGVS